MTRRLLSMFCALALCLSLLPGTALAAEEVSYLAYSWNGSELTSETESVSDYTTVATSTTTWSDGWYVVSGTVNVGDLRNTTVTVNGIVNLILTAGSNVNLTYGTISINDGGTLNIYGQEGSSGTLTLAGNRGSTNSGIVLGSGSALNIHGGTVTATGYCTNATSPAPGIDVGGSGTLTVYGGEVTAEAGTYNGAGIRVTSSGTVSIYGGTVTATGASNKSANGYPGAGIGGNGGSSAGETCGTVNIYGGTVTATGGSGGSGASAGIGGGQGGKTNNQGGGGNVTITGGTVTATGGKNSTGAVQAPGIGGAVYSSSQGNAGSFSTGTNGSAVITTTGGIQAGTSGCSAIIDNKVYGNVTLPDSQLSSKNLTVTNGATLTISGEKTLSSSITVNDGGTLTVSGTVTNSGTITVESGGTLTGTGTIHNTDSGKVTNNGTNDTVTITYPSTVTVTSDKDGNTAAPGTQVEFTATVSGTAGTPTGTVTFKDGDASLGSEELDDTGKATYTVSTSDDLDIGEHTITAEYTPAGDAAYTESSGSLTFTVVGDVASIKIKTPPTTMTYTTGQALDLTGLEITVSYAGSSYKQDITWSADSGITAKIDNVEVDNNTVLSASQHNGKAVTITYEGQSAQTSALSVSKANQTGFAFTEESPETVTYGDEPFTVEAIGGQSTGEVTYTVNEGGGDVVNINSTSGEVTILKAGTATITATKAADGDYNAATDTLEVTVNSKSLEGAQVQVSGSYIYDGNAKEPSGENVTVTLDGEPLTADDYTLSYTNNTNAGEATVKATGKDNYSGTAEGTFTINKAEPTVSEVEVSSPETIYDTTDISAITLTSTGTEGTVALDAGQTLTVGEGS